MEMKCESCGQMKEVANVEGHLLCSECSEDVIRCDLCRKILGLSYDDLVDNWGRLSVPELGLPDVFHRLVFCDIEHLERYLKNYLKKEKKEEKKDEKR